MIARFLLLNARFYFERIDRIKSAEAFECLIEINGQSSMSGSGSAMQPSMTCPVWARSGPQQTLRGRM